MAQVDVFRLDGIDIAHPYQYHQPVDWAAVPDLPLLCVKATQSTSYRNPEFEATWDAMRQRHFTYRVAYHYLQPRVNGRAQADFFLDMVLAQGPLRTGETIMCDKESTKVDWLRSELPDMTITRDFYQRVVERVGHIPEMNAPRCLHYEGGFTPSSSDPFTQSLARWLPNYTSVPSPAGTVIRQWGGAGQGAFCPGINGGTTRVDSNQIEDPTVLNLVAGYTGGLPPIGDDMPEYLRARDGNRPPTPGDPLGGDPATWVTDGVKIMWVSNGEMIPLGAKTRLVDQATIYSYVWADGVIPVGASLLWEASKFTRRTIAGVDELAIAENVVAKMPAPPAYGGSIRLTAG